MSEKISDDTNISALKRLRDLPRGTQVESRINAIKNLLGESEVFKTLQNLRWPKGIICPNCNSHNVIILSPPKDSPDHRHYYQCLDCKKEGSPSEFDDFTGLPMADSFHELREWMLCWYLIGFCSITQVARVLGLSLQKVMLMAEQGAHLTEVKQEVVNELEKGFFLSSYKDKKKQSQTQKKEQVAKDELNTRSKSLGKFKPGPKSSA